MPHILKYINVFCNFLFKIFQIAPLPQNANVPSLNMHTYVPRPKMSGKQPVSDPEQLNACKNNLLLYIL